jgi:hypothetical protein
MPCFQVDEMKLKAPKVKIADSQGGTGHYFTLVWHSMEMNQSLTLL